MLWVFMWAASPRVWPWFFGAAAATNTAVIVVFVAVSPPPPVDCDVVCFPWTARWIVGGVLGLVVCAVQIGVTAALCAFGRSGAHPLGQSSGGGRQPEEEVW